MTQQFDYSLTQYLLDGYANHSNVCKACNERFGTKIHLLAPMI